MYSSAGNGQDQDPYAGRYREFFDQPGIMEGLRFRIDEARMTSLGSSENPEKAEAYRVSTQQALGRVGDLLLASLGVGPLQPSAPRGAQGGPAEENLDQDSGQDLDQEAEFGTLGALQTRSGAVGGAKRGRKPRTSRSQPAPGQREWQNPGSEAASKPVSEENFDEEEEFGTLGPLRTRSGARAVLGAKRGREPRQAVSAPAPTPARGRTQGGSSGGVVTRAGSTGRSGRSGLRSAAGGGVLEAGAASQANGRGGVSRGRGRKAASTQEQAQVRANEPLEAGQGVL